MKRKSNKNRKIIFILAALSLLISAVYAGTYFATPFLKEKQNNPDAAAALKNEGKEAADIIRDYIDKQSVESLIRKKISGTVYVSDNKGAYENAGIDFYFYNGILYYETTQEKGKIYKVESSELLKPEFIKKYDFEKYSKYINTALDSIYENYASLADSMKYENKPGEGYELNGSHVSVYSVLLEKANLKKAASGTIDALYDNSDTSVYMGMFSAYGDNTKFLYSTEWSWIHLPKEKKLKTYTDRQLARFTYAQADIHIGENDNLKRIKIDNYQLDFDYDGTEYDFTVSADIKFDDAADTPPGN